MLLRAVSEELELALDWPVPHWLSIAVPQGVSVLCWDEHQVVRPDVDVVEDATPF